MMMMTAAETTRPRNIAIEAAQAASRRDQMRSPRRHHVETQHYALAQAAAASAQDIRRSKGRARPQQHHHHQQQQQQQQPQNLQQQQQQHQQPRRVRSTFARRDDEIARAQESLMAFTSDRATSMSDPRSDQRSLLQRANSSSDIMMGMSPFPKQQQQQQQSHQDLSSLRRDKRRASTLDISHLHRDDRKSRNNNNNSKKSYPEDPFSATSTLPSSSSSSSSSRKSPATSPRNNSNNGNGSSQAAKSRQRRHSLSVPDDISPDFLMSESHKMFAPEFSPTFEAPVPSLQESSQSSAGSAGGPSRSQRNVSPIRTLEVMEPQDMLPPPPPIQPTMAAPYHRQQQPVMMMMDPMRSGSLNDEDSFAADSCWENGTFKSFNTRELEERSNRGNMEWDDSTLATEITNTTNDFNLAKSTRKLTTFEDMPSSESSHHRHSSLSTATTTTATTTASSSLGSSQMMEEGGGFGTIRQNNAFKESKTGIRHNSASTASEKRRSSHQRPQRQPRKETAALFVFRRKNKEGKVDCEATLKSKNPQEDTMADLVRQLQGQKGQASHGGLLTFSKREVSALKKGQRRIVFVLKQVKGAKFGRNEFGTMRAAEVLMLTRQATKQQQQSVIIDIATESVVVNGETMDLF